MKAHSDSTADSPSVAERVKDNICIEGDRHLQASHLKQLKRDCSGSEFYPHQNYGLQLCWNFANCDVLRDVYKLDMGPFGCNELREQMVHLNLEFSGGSEIVVGKKKFHQIDLPSDPSITIRDLIQWMMSSLIEKDKAYLLVANDTVRPGVLVLVNDVDWEVLSGVDTTLKEGDTVTFLSTIHGG
ncbi:unnamed protein product [Enterobius vermicularis]|uniref:Ubiquitin-related modifier 1 homolog n=1 Tax=Enterobius vermicularis TaxID=51028 RepID=A0A0N4VF19_ENTVE|nr:unnamed protein product [Enterobius vermicularis]